MNLLDLMVKIGIDDQASDRINGIATGIKGKFGSAIQTAGRAVVGATAAVGAGAAAMTTAAVQGYASYEQLVGGVNKLYGDASEKLQGYAQDAYSTAGMSANQYMEQATSFSASLISSLGGDVDKAADMTDVAMRAMSDNVNTFGTDMGSVQNAFQGFAKSNFTMLDNLKLGFSGTKDGAEQLVAAAAKMTKEQDKLGLSVDGNSLSFANMVSAIAVMQEHMDIAGTTSREAMTTIEGSVASTRASWENFLTALGTGDQEMVSNAVSGLVDGIFGTFNEKLGEREGGIINNVIPIVQNVFASIGEQLPGLVQQLGEQVTGALAQYLGIDTSEVEGRFQTAWDNITSAFDTAKERIGEVIGFIKDTWTGFSENFDSSGFEGAMENLGAIVEQVWGFIQDNILPHGEELGAVFAGVADAVGLLADGFTKVMEIIGPFLPAILGAVAAVKGFMIVQSIIGFFTTLAGVFTTVATIVSGFGGVLGTVAALLGGWPVILVAVIGAIVGFIATNKDAKKALKDVWEGIKRFFSDWWEGVKIIFSQVKDAFGKFGDYAKQAYDGAVKWFGQIPDAITGFFRNAGDWLFNAGSNIINGFFNGLKDAWNGVSSWVSGIGGWIAEHKGPESYDKRLLTPAGRWIMGSLHDGMEGAFESEVLPYVSGLADKMQGAFGRPVLAAGVSPAGAYGTQPGPISPTATRDLTVILQLDRTQLGRAVYRLNNEETQRVGLSLAGGY